MLRYELISRFEYQTFASPLYTTDVAAYIGKSNAHLVVIIVVRK